MRNIRIDRLTLLLQDYTDKSLYLYGAGNRGKVALDNIMSVGMDYLVKGFVDDAPRTSSIMGKSVYSFTNLSDKDIKTAYFLPTTNSVKKMVNRLGRLGIPAEHVLFIPELMITNIHNEKIDYTKVEVVKSFLNDGDTLSGFIYNTILDIYKSGNIGVLSQTMGECQYFPIDTMSDHVPGFTLGQDECFIDCGAYDGDTIKVFKDLTGDRFDKIYAFEADKGNYQKLSYHYASDSRMKLIDKAVWSSECELHFSSGNKSTSSINEHGQEIIQAVTLDKAVDDRVTLIKMDIEGAEMEALKGAAELIRRFHPKLAICIYHKLEDMWEIPIYIKSLYDDYHIYIRNYQDRLDEIVCYAIP